MTDHKYTFHKYTFTEDEIIEALKCCKSKFFCCSSCPLNVIPGMCGTALKNLSFDIINRQKSDIEILEGDLIEERTRRKNAVDAYHEQKVEIGRLNSILLNEAIMPPVKIGQTVYSALAYDDEEDTIEEYTVDGLGYIDGEWFVWCEKDTDWYKLGTEYCQLTREDAEKVLAERGKK